MKTKNKKKIGKRIVNNGVSTPAVAIPVVEEVEFDHSRVEESTVFFVVETLCRQNGRCYLLTEWGERWDGRNVEDNLNDCDVEELSPRKLREWIKRERCGHASTFEDFARIDEEEKNQKQQENQNEGK